LPVNGTTTYVNDLGKSYYNNSNYRKRLKLDFPKESTVTKTAILDLIKSAKANNAHITISCPLHGEAFAGKCAQEGGRGVTILV